MLGRETRRGSRLVVVLEEAREPVLVVEAREEVLPHRPCLAALEAVVEPLVVRVVEALLLEGPLEVPVDLREEEEARDSSRRTGGRRLGQKGSAGMPHVLSNTSGRTSIAMSHRTPSHCPAIRSSSPSIASLQCRVAVVELEGVRPAVEVRVAAVGEDALRRAGPVLRRRREMLLGPVDEVLRVLRRPTGGPAPRGSGRSRGSDAGRAGEAARGGARAPRRRRSPRGPGTRAPRRESPRRPRR